MITSSIRTVEPKTFATGSVGWRVSDFDDPQIERLLHENRCEIIEGVLVPMAAASFDPNLRLMALQAQIQFYQHQQGIRGAFSIECDIVLDDTRLVVADMVWMTFDQVRQQTAVAAERGRANPRRAPLYVPPSLVIESVSYGLEDRDRITKHRWYAEFGVPHYWVFDALRHGLECFVLEDDRYTIAASGREKDRIAVPLFEGLVVDLEAIWRDD